jgi:hypothetical protein
MSLKTRIWVIPIALLFLARGADALGILNCGERCHVAYSGDSAECVNARVLGQANCRVISSCSLIVIDPDGPFGPLPPTLGWSCSYGCTFDQCIWV